MNDKQIEYYRKIVKDAPEGATHVSHNFVFYKLADNTPYESMVWWARGEEWIDTDIDHLTTPIDNLRTIVEQAETIKRLERERDDLEEWQRGFYALSCYLVFHDSNNPATMLEAKELLAKRDLECEIKGIQRVKECREIELSNGEYDTLTLIQEQLRKQSEVSE